MDYQKILETLEDMQQDEAGTISSFGNALKDGVGDTDYIGKILDLLMFASLHHPTKLNTLDTYIQRMKADQKEIFYTASESRDVVEHFPHLEAFKAKDYEVLYLVSPVDEFLAQYVFEF